MAGSVKRGEAGNVVTGVLAAVGVGTAVQVGGAVNFVLSGVFVATLRLAASWDAGATWILVTSADGTLRTFAAPERVVIDEPEDGVLYRAECTAWTSGAAAWRFSK